MRDEDRPRLILLGTCQNLCRRHVNLMGSSSAISEFWVVIISGRVRGLLRSISRAF